jgi:hypothetical protein
VWMGVLFGVGASPDSIGERGAVEDEGWLSIVGSDGEGLDRCITIDAGLCGGCCCCCSR